MAADDIVALVALVASERPDLIVIGPEAPLVVGLADVLRASGFTVFGPGAGAARLEGSKSFAKDLMIKAAACRPPGQRRSPRSSRRSLSSTTSEAARS